tara:strand:+ start:14725 stop:14979 length:255 start_codon:yes stop_codon:yes gene_type:complete
MAIDKRISIETYAGQRKTLQNLLVQFLAEEIDHEVVKGATTLIREARMVIQAEAAANKGNVNTVVKGKGEITPNGPFPRLIKPL